MKRNKENEKGEAIWKDAEMERYRTYKEIAGAIPKKNMGTVGAMGNKRTVAPDVLVSFLPCTDRPG